MIKRNNTGTAVAFIHSNRAPAAVLQRDATPVLRTEEVFSLLEEELSDAESLAEEREWERNLSALRTFAMAGW